jgi:hypothetical protein
LAIPGLGPGPVSPKPFRRRVVFGEPILSFALFPGFPANLLLILRDRNCQHVKGLPIFYGQFAVLPAAVREYEIQEFAFFRRGLTFEQDVGIVRQLQELDAFLDIAAVGVLVGLNIAHHGCLGCAHLRRLGVEVLGGDTAVEFVLVHGVDSVLEAAVLTLELGNGVVMELAFVTMTFS